MSKSSFSRRDILKGLSLLGAGVAGSALLRGRRRRAHAQPLLSADDDTRFLIVLCASGGASIIDSLMAIRESESANAQVLNTFPDSQVISIADSPFRAVDSSGPSVGAIPVPFTANQSAFVNKHHDDMMVATWGGTSVNHAVAQRRAVTGNEAWNGRTLQEVTASSYGANYVLPNVHLVSGTNYTARGTDSSLPDFAFGEPVPDPSLWPLALDGVRGTRHAVDRDALNMARRLRDEKLEPSTRFTDAFGSSKRVQHWMSLRGRQSAIEDADLITKLMVQPDSPEYPLSASGLSESADARRVRDAFPGFASDPLEAQAALAFLLLKNRVSVTVTLGVGFDAVVQDGVDLSGGGLPEGSIMNPPIAFDFSHQGHRATQAFMWDRMYRVADGLIALLQAEEYADGQSMWDRSMIYLATDFGRSKNRPAGATEWGTAHNLNNGILAISPLVSGNTILGGVDPDTALTYGFDPSTGAPEPGRTTTEAEIFSGLVGALGVDSSGSGLPDVKAMRRG